LLPQTYLQRLTSCGPISSFDARGNKRSNTRVPVSLRGEVLCIDRDRTGAALAVRLRDLSCMGVGILMPAKGTVTAEFVLGVCVKGFDTHWMLCRTRRSATFDGICSVIGASFEKVLYPGQEIQPGQMISSLLWMDVEGLNAARGIVAGVCCSCLIGVVLILVYLGVR
jgi:hypothetical protein